ncbi:hypothetical protein Tco_0012202 [Tanacetum coccineum]
MFLFPAPSAVHNCRRRVNGGRPRDSQLKRSAVGNAATISMLYHNDTPFAALTLVYVRPGKYSSSRHKEAAIDIVCGLTGSDDDSKTMFLALSWLIGVRKILKMITMSPNWAFRRMELNTKRYSGNASSTGNVVVCIQCAGEGEGFMKYFIDMGQRLEYDMSSRLGPTICCEHCNGAEADHGDPQSDTLQNELTFLIHSFMVNVIPSHRRLNKCIWMSSTDIIIVLIMFVVQDDSRSDVRKILHQHQELASKKIIPFLQKTIIVRSSLMPYLPNLNLAVKSIVIDTNVSYAIILFFASPRHFLQKKSASKIETTSSDLFGYEGAGAATSILC